MTWNLTLDILLVLLILLFAPIGYMRGPVKELLVTLGVVYGALMVEFWARPWGRDLDYYFDVGDDPGAFIVAMSLLMGSTFIGGFGLGLLLGPWEYSTRGRIAGGLTAMVNGALLVAFSLQYVRLFLLSDANEEALEESVIVRLLMDEVGWVMLGAAVVVPVAILYALITHRRAYEHVGWGEYEEEEYYEDYAYLDDDFAYEYDYPVTSETVEHQPDHMAETRVMPPRIHPAASDDQTVAYKTEPEPLPIRTLESTREIDVEEGPEEPSGAVDFPEQEWVAIGETDPELAVVEPSSESPSHTDEQLPEPEETEATPVSSDLPEGYFRCANCHAVLPPDTRLCPVCGYVH